MDLRLNLFRKMFQSLMVTTVKLISLPLQLTTPSLNLKCLKHNLQIHNFLDFLLLNADGNKNEMKLLGCDLHCGHWCLITLILKALANRNVPSTMNRSTSLWSSSQMAVKAQPTFQLGWHYDPKTHEIYLGSTADFWSFEDGFLVRNHVWSRDCTFHTTDFPLSAEKLQTTNGLTMRRNSRIILVNACPRG